RPHASESAHPRLRRCATSPQARGETVLVLTTSSSWTMHNLSPHSLTRNAFDRAVACKAKRTPPSSHHRTHRGRPSEDPPIPVRGADRGSIQRESGLDEG